jgi:hypothetical protein
MLVDLGPANREGVQLYLSRLSAREVSEYRSIFKGSLLGNFGYHVQFIFRLSNGMAVIWDIRPCNRTERSWHGNVVDAFPRDSVIPIRSLPLSTSSLKYCSHSTHKLLCSRESLETNFRYIVGTLKTRRCGAWIVSVFKTNMISSCWVKSVLN